jgi:hypothetical protein
MCASWSQDLCSWWSGPPVTALLRSHAAAAHAILQAPHLHAAALPSSSASLIKHTGAVAVAERNNSYSALVHMWHATTTPVGQTGKAKDARLYKASAGISARARTSLCGRGGTWSVCVRSVSVSHTWQVKMRALAPHRARCSHSRRGLASPRGTQPRLAVSAGARAAAAAPETAGQPAGCQAVQAGDARTAAAPRRSSHRPVCQAVRHAVRLLNVQQHGRVVVCIALVAACISCEHCLNVSTHNIELQHTHQADQSRSRAVVRQAQQHLRALNRPCARRSHPWTGPAATQARTEPLPVMPVMRGHGSQEALLGAAAHARRAPPARTCPMWPTASTSQCPVLCRTPSCQPHVARARTAAAQLIDHRLDPMYAPGITDSRRQAKQS